MSDLTYVGDGRFVVGVPAENLTDDEIEALAAERNTKPAEFRKALLDSGLYEAKEKKEPKS